MPTLDELYRAAIRAHQQGQTAIAARLYDDILAQQPSHAGALHLKGVLALQSGNYDTAADLIERSLKIEPRHSLALSNLGVVYRGLKRYDAAIEVLRKSVALDPNSADAWGNLGQTLSRAGRMVEAVASYKRALAIDPNRLGLQSALLFAENYIADSDPFEMADRARAVGALIAQKVPARTAHANDPDPERRLRVGLLSADLRGHPVGRFLAGVLPALDPARVELFAYSNTDEEDAVTDLMRPAVPHWLSVHAMSDRDLDARIVADGIDILMDLSGHTGGNRMMVVARKPAPVCFSWIGYFATTGLPAIDYVLANRWVIPEAEEGQWSEKPWRLPDTYICYAIPRDPLSPTPLPALTAGHVTFGSFNNFNKLTGATFAAWSALLAAVPAAAQETLRTALAMGADRAILVQTDAEVQPLAVAKVLKALVEKEQPDLVILGKQAIDDDANQTGQMLATLWGRPQATFASKLDVDGGKATVVREVDAGLETLEVDLPAVVTTDLRLNEPRFIKLPDIMKAKSKPMETLQFGDLGVESGDFLGTTHYAPPAARSRGVMVKDAAELVAALKQKGLL